MESLTFEKCIEITNNSVFYKTDLYYKSYKIVIFNYRMANYYDFVKNDALELRGLMFVFNEDGTLYKRYLKMPKFFNINENEGNLIGDVKNLKIKKITNKLDGSFISFIKLPNNEVIACTKNSIDNDQTKLANKIYETNKKLSNFINEKLDNDIVVFFELVSPQNRIVLEYNETKLVLIGLRDNKTGEYLESDEIEKSESFNYSLDEIIEIQKTSENLEGFVVQFENDKFVKFKTDWYFKMHKICTDFYRTNDIIEFILDEKIDDVLSKITSIELKLEIIEIMALIQIYINDTKSIIDEKLKEFSAISRKEFAYKYKDCYWFPILIKCLSNNYYEVINEYIKKKTNKLNLADKFIHELK